MINILIWLLAGGLIGWVASMIMRTDPHGMILNLAVGIFGAMVGGWVISPLVGIPMAHDNAAFNGGAFIVSLIGAVTLLGLFNLLRPVTARRG
jgi:uncharacterized membrane protein YeaQ/YmgE (transglycosylase-associated protein family)